MSTAELDPQLNIPADMESLTEVKPHVEDTLSPDTLEYIEHIRKHGDIFDARLPRLHHSVVDGVPLRIGVAVSAADLALWDVTYYPAIPGSVAIIGATTGAVGASILAQRYRTYKHHRKGMEELSAAQEDIGLPVEFYRPKKSKEVVVRMYTDDEPTSTAQLAAELEALTQLVDHSNLGEVTLPLKRIEDFAPYDIKDRAEEHRSWLHRIKGPQVIDETIVDTDTPAEEQQLVTLSHEELHELRDKVMEASSNEPLDTIMRILARTEPRHRALRDYELFKTRPEQFRDRLERSLHEAVSRRLDDVTAVREEDLATNGGYLKRKLYVSGSPEVDDTGKALISWRSATTHLPLHTEGLLSSHKITEQGLVELLKVSDSLPPVRVTELAELGAWLCIKNVLEADFDGFTHLQSNGGGNEQDVEHTPGLQERTLEHIFHKPGGNDIEIMAARKWRARLRTVVALAIVAVGSTHAANTAMDYAVEEFSRASDRLEAKGVMPADYEEVKDEMNTFGSNVYSAVEAIDDHVYQPSQDFIDELGITAKDSGTADAHARDQLGGGSSSTSPDRSMVGNIGGDEDDNKPAWWIKSYNGMDSEGYWAQARYDALSVSLGLNWVQADINGDRSSDYSNVHPMPLTSPKKLDGSQPMLHVSRPDIASSTVLRFSNLTDDPDFADLDARLIYVPILEGTRIAAVQLADKDAKVMAFINDDGQQFIAVDASSEYFQQISYWLVPDNSVRPISADPVHIYDHRDGKSEYLDVGESVNTAWEQYLGHPLPEDPEEALKIKEKIIREDFTYDLNPIKHKGSLESIQSYLDEVFATELANCNVATTLQVISNPNDRMPVAGYFNSNNEQQQKDGTTYLSSQESHMWAVDAAGQIHDTTPSGGNTGDFGKEDFDNRQVDETQQDRRLARTMEALKFVSIGSVAVGSLLMRRRLARGAKAGRQHIDELQTRITRDHRIQNAHAAVNHALYAQTPTTYKRPANPASREDALRSIGWQAESPTPPTLATPKTAPKDLKRDLRLARRLAKRIQRAQPTS